MNNTEFYSTYKDAGQSPELILLHGARWLISLVGLTLNTLLVTATVRSKNLRNRCNILIGAEASANLLYQLSPSIPFFLALAGTNFIPLDRCLLYQLASLFGVHMSLLCALLIGLDRLLSIKFPIWINRHKGNGYVAVLVGTSMAYAAGYLVYCYRLCTSGKSKSDPVMCTITLDCYQGLVVETKCMYSAIFLNLATITVYSLLWVAVKQTTRAVQPKDGKSADTFTRRILKSLLLITCFTIFGWTAATCSRLALTFLPLSQTESVFFINAVSFLTNLTSASHGPVLYTCSEDYRRAFRQLLHLEPASANKNDGNQQTMVVRRFSTQPHSGAALQH